jgi:hypothetical protein
LIFPKTRADEILRRRMRMRDELRQGTGILGRPEKIFSVVTAVEGTMTVRDCERVKGEHEGCMVVR